MSWWGEVQVDALAARAHAAAGVADLLGGPGGDVAPDPPMGRMPSGPNSSNAKTRSGNLEAVDGPANEAKGDDDAANWLPPSNGFRCAYVARQIAVKLTYRLWVTTEEKRAMQGALGNCHDQTLPTESSSGVALTP